MKEFYKDFIGVYENVFSEETCLQIIKYFEEARHKNPRDRKEPKSYGVYAADIADTSVELYDKKLAKLVKNKIFQCAKQYKKKYRYFAGCVGIKDVKLQKTEPTEGYHVFHMEDSAVFTVEEPLGWSLRKGVYTVYLNDVEEGGETEFLYQKFRLKPKRGSVCIFPGAFTHTHRGNTPFSNTKYIITGWLVSCPGDKESLKIMENNQSIISRGKKYKDLSQHSYVFNNIDPK